MIYVLKSAGYNTSGQHIDLLKIGYSSDWKTRKTQYLLHNPTIQTLYEIENLEEEWEHKLHYKFKKYRYKDYGNEWFYCRDEILEYFKTHNTPNLIREDEDLKSINRVKRARIKQKDKILVGRIITLWLTLDAGTDRNKYYKNSLKLNEIEKDVIRKTISFERFSIDYVYEVLKSDYNVPSDIIQLIKEELLKTYPEKIQNIINSFNYQYTTFIDKMKYLCNQKSVLSEAEYNVVLEQIPMEYRNYIVVLGPERIKANSYAKSRLEEEYRSIVNQQENYSDLEKEIFCQFKPGDKDTKVNIKNKIGQIYQKVGYTKTPKATDLEQYFEIRTCRISNKLTGKKDAGFEIIKKKGD